MNLAPYRRTLAPLLADGSELEQVRAQLIRLAEDVAALSVAAVSPDPFTWVHLHCSYAPGSPDVAQMAWLARYALPLGVSLVCGGSEP